VNKAIAIAHRETLIVLEGDLRIDFRDGAVHLSAGEMFVVPKGVQHKPYAEQEVKLLLVEPRGVLNTGHEGGERTAGNDVWISKRDTSLARDCGGQQHDSSQKFEAEQVPFG